MNAFQTMTTALTGRSPWSFAVPERATAKPETKTERMRNYLRQHGSASAATLADEADVPQTALVAALLKGDMARGSVFYRGKQYHWNHQFDAELHEQLSKAAALLRAHGYTVTKPQARAA